MKDGVFFRPFVGASYAGGGLFGKRQDGEGDGGKPSLGGLLVGLLAPGDSKLLEIMGYRVWTSE
jgi:hypothetical protein